MCYSTERSGRRDEEQLGEIRRLFDRYRSFARRTPLVEEDLPVAEAEEADREEARPEPVLH